MGEVISYTKAGIDGFIKDAAVVGSDLILTHGDGTTLTIDLSGVSSVTQADIDAAVAGVLAGAPGALDTLNELAAAIGDDANYAASVTTALAGKASTGDVTAEATARANADALLIPLTQKAAANGVATLDANTRIPAAQLPVFSHNTQTDNYTTVLADGNGATIVEMNAATAKTITIPANADVAYPIGTILMFRQIGAGQATIAGAAGVTVRQRETKLKIAGQWGEASAIKRGTNEWVLSGDVSA